jgi:hypothetical protein
MNEREAIEIYEKEVKKLLERKDYGAVSDLISGNPEVKRYIEELRTMVNYYQSRERIGYELLETAKKSLEEVIIKLEKRMKQK